MLCITVTPSMGKQWVGLAVLCRLGAYADHSQTKIALRCSDEEELLVMQAQAQSLNLCARSIRDAFVVSHSL